MDKMCNRVCEIIADYESDGILQSQLWKKFKLSSRDGSRLALKLERMGMITREKILEKENKDLLEKYKDAKGKFVKPSDHAPLVASFDWSG